LAISPTAPHTIISNGNAIETGSPIPMPNKFSASSQSGFSAAAWSSWLAVGRFDDAMFLLAAVGVVGVPCVAVKLSRVVGVGVDIGIVGVSCVAVKVRCVVGVRVSRGARRCRLGRR
jgi:hypothetical protein